MTRPHSKNTENSGASWIAWIRVFVRWSKRKVRAFHRIMTKVHKDVANWHAEQFKRWM